MAKPETDQKKSERLHMLISPDELDAIDDWRFANRISTRAEAVRRLVQIGLRFDAQIEKIDTAARALSYSADRLVRQYYAAPDLTTEMDRTAVEALRQMREVMRRAQSLVEATASIELQRDYLIDAAKSIEHSIGLADEILELFAEDVSQKEQGK